MNKKILASSVLAACALGASVSANAALTNGSTLNFDSAVLGGYYGTTVVGGSYFGMDTNGGGVAKNERTGLSMNDGLVLGTVQAASGSHSGAPDGSESAGIDSPWNFFNNTGMHYSASATNVLSASGNTASVDFSGWGVTWNGIPAINMGGGAWNGNADGVADVTCGVDCGDGDTFTLDYSATVPVGDPSGFGGVNYLVHLEGTVSAVPVPAAVWLFGSGLIGLAGVARRRKAA